MVSDHLTRAVATEKIGRLRREADAGRLGCVAVAGRPHRAHTVGWAFPLNALLSLGRITFRPAPGPARVTTTRQPQPCGC